MGHAHFEFFPAKNNIDKHYSPYMILHKKTLDYKKICQVEFGSFVQVPSLGEPTNTNDSRTLDAIYLRPMMNEQGGHEVMDLQTGKVIKRGKVFPLPMTEQVKARIRKMAHDQGVTTYYFQNRRKETIRMGLTMHVGSTNVLSKTVAMYFPASLKLDYAVVKRTTRSPVVGIMRLLLSFEIN